jgi:hypothetical protein
LAGAKAGFWAVNLFNFCSTLLGTTTSYSYFHDSPCRVLVALRSATQDIVFEAYRAEVLMLMKLVLCRSFMLGYHLAVGFGRVRHLLPT